MLTVLAHTNTYIHFLKYSHTNLKTQTKIKNNNNFNNPFNFYAIQNQIKKKKILLKKKTNKEQIRNQRKLHLKTK